MKNKYQTIYEASYGEVTAQFKEEMTFEEAEYQGKLFCLEKGLKYIRTELNSN